MSNEEFDDDQRQNNCISKYDKIVNQFDELIDMVGMITEAPKRQQGLPSLKLLLVWHKINSDWMAYRIQEVKRYAKKEEGALRLQPQEEEQKKGVLVLMASKEVHCLPPTLTTIEEEEYWRS
ncbi:hypothetical protein L6452_24540 [Arctium lappa]|uniref:Uncharacterized protein n=1 Tax=Arctium lappa TaxID=4217 RepID=A0ACB9A9P7_ARCLA|nr:hypothetical protein L6452_24540 [Arctium lappa]